MANRSNEVFLTDSGPEDVLTLKDLMRFGTTRACRLLLNPVVLAGTVLVASGLLHLMLLWITGAAWSGPLSPRKPALFGISGGLTIWSIAWVVSQLLPHRFDRSILSLFAVSLLLEVTLITIQYWRGVPSHFNHTTPLDALIEFTMFGLIMFAVAVVVWLTWRSSWLGSMPASRALAIRAGLWLLLIACGLGMMTTIGGEVNVANGQPSETWGRAGVLKYPHGAVLHAIQVLPLIAGLLERLRVANAVRLVGAAVWAHVLFVAHALWQLALGRSRFDVDFVSGTMLVTAGILILVPLIRILRGSLSPACRSWSRSTSITPVVSQTGAINSTLSQRSGLNE